MTWDDVRLEIANARDRADQSGYDLVRRAKVAAAERISDIPLMVYAADFTSTDRAGANGPSVQIELDDKTGILQATSDIPDGPLDVLIHSPGGSLTATQSIVYLLRSRFDPIRFIIPHTAKSAATMLALSGNEILLGEAGELGPIDPQLQIFIDQRSVTVPARAALDQFERIESDVIADPLKLRSRLPIIRQYGPSFLQECTNAIERSEALATEWLRDYMFAGYDDADKRAKKVAQWLADHNNFRIHSSPVWMEQLLEVEPTLRIRQLADAGDGFANAIMDVYWAIDVTFNGTPAVKIIEHQYRSAYIRLKVTALMAQVSQDRPPNQDRVRRRQMAKQANQVKPPSPKGRRGR